METERIEGTAGGGTLVDVFAPESNANGAAVLLLHGGGWMMGERSFMHGYAELLAAKGFLALAVQYRLLGEAPWPAQLEDVRAAIRWVKANGKRLGVAPEKVSTVGFSAGAHLALLAAGTSDDTAHVQTLGDGSGTSVAATVGFFAPVMLAGPDRLPMVDMLTGGGEDAALAVSPVTYAGPGFPATLLLTGDEDLGVPTTMTLQFYQKLVEAGAKPELHLLRAQNHEFSALPSMIGPVMDEVAFFLDRVVVRPEHFDEENRALNMFANPEAMAAMLEQANPGQG